MNELIQAAIEAVDNGQTDRAKDYLKQAIDENPTDIDGWMMLAAITEDQEKKRDYLDHALILDPTNDITREELLNMNRAERKNKATQSRGSASAKSDPMAGRKIIKGSMIKKVAAFVIGIVCLVFGASRGINALATSSNPLIALIFMGLGLYLIGSALLAIQ